MRVAILILNYNGRDLLEECLPSVLHAAQQSRYECHVILIDNDSSDESLEFLAATFPEVEVLPRPNRGLCSFNDVIEGASGDFDYPVALLLNNDLKLASGAIDPLVEPFHVRAGHNDDQNAPAVFLSAPLCWQFDGVTCEGFKTAVRWRYGLVQATGRFPGHQRAIRVPGETACAGAALAVNCQLFRELGGFDPLYLPGRIEDLDLAYRAWQRGWSLRYVPDAIAFHKGQVSFGREHGKQGCDHLAWRNTLLFQWKNLRSRRSQVRQLFGCGLRIARDLVTAPLRSNKQRWEFLRAWLEARRLWKTRGVEQRTRNSSTPRNRRRVEIERELEFFQRFSQQTLLSESRGQAIEYPATSDPTLNAEQIISGNMPGTSPENRPAFLSGVQGGR
ncbi:MAG: glycosyltransferase [Pirellulales bacterium]|nr:glycosyltransferase [Pirellulales bacterium]